MIEGHVGIADFAMSLTIELVLLARFHKSSTVLWANCRKNSTKSPSLDSGPKLIMRLFRGETKPSKHRFKPSEQIRRTSFSDLKVSRLEG